MRMFRVAWVGAVATLAIAVGGPGASAQSPQFYGYPSKQAPAPSGQGGGPGSGCYVEKIGCNVNVCPPPACQNACYEITSKIPPLEIPSCQNACVIVNELPPAPAATVTIFRNHYVPIRIENKATNVQAVNIDVKWREIHYLCDCAPGSSQCPHVPMGAPQSAPQSAPQGPASVPPPPAVSAAPVATAPVAAAEVNTPAKRWVWLAKQGVYGFGYQNAQGFWVIDANSKRPTAPEGATTAAAQPATTNVTAATPATPATPASL